MTLHISSVDVPANRHIQGCKTFPWLFAAGGITGSVHGGDAVADIVTFGRIAGTNATAH